MDDDFGTDVPAQTAWGYLVDILDAACPLSDKLIIGSTPRAANDAGKLASSNYLKHYCAVKNASWLFFDSYFLMGSYADMSAIFGVGDGTHPTTATSAYAAEILWEFLGLNSFYMGYVPRAVNDTGTASKLSSGTRFHTTGGAGYGEIVGDINGFQWQYRGTYTAGFADTNGNVGLQVSFNPSWPNVMPLVCDYGAAGGPYKCAVSAASGVEFTQFIKNTNPGGGFMNLQVGLLHTGFTRAELVAINANAVLGAIAFCTDCAAVGGAQLVYARGGNPADWVTVDGKLAI
jgi:hypothetical protein